MPPFATSNSSARPPLHPQAGTLPDTIRAANPDIPWRLIIATRNRLIHGYLGIDNDTLWSVIRDHLPVLLPQLRELRELRDRLT